MNDPWIEFAIRIQSIAQAGLQYDRDVYDRERYAELRRISAEMLALKTDLPVEKVYGLFCNESGYQTPKVDTRAAVFEEGRVLLARENNGTWALPGGWCDVDHPWPPTRRRKCGRKRGFPLPPKELSPFRIGASTM